MQAGLREEKSNEILHTLYGMKQYKEARILLAYADYQSEVITTPLIIKALAENKQVFTPRVNEDEMEFYRISGIEHLAKGYKGIREPIGNNGFTDGIDAGDFFIKNAKPLMVMPGAVFDKEGHRIGYGKGFYDRYLKRFNEAGIDVYKIALCYECQLLEKIPDESHDVGADVIITENRVIFCTIS